MRAGVAEEHKRFSHAGAYTAFAATGFGCALPGALMPELLAGWHLSDERGGLLILLMQAGSSAGALLAGGKPRRRLVPGTLLLTASSALLAIHGSRVAPGLMFAFGLGLGLTMTAITLLMQGASAELRSLRLTRLNLLWALGAFICPPLLVHGLLSGSTRGVLLGTAVCFAALSLWLWLEALQNHPSGTQTMALQTQRRGSLLRVPVSLILLTMLVTGIEASGGAWLAAYAQRLAHSVSLTAGAPAVLWGGLLVSRLIGSAQSAEAWFRKQLIGLLLLVLAMLAGLAFTGGGLFLLVLTFFLGFGLGPLYPAVLARVLKRQETGAIFFLAGVSAAVMPWWTGLVSTRTGSLRLGLLVPLAGALVMLFCGLAAPPEPQASSTE